MVTGSVEHRVAAAVHIALTRTTACHQVASRSTKLGVNNEVQDEVDSEVWEQEEVGELGGCLKRAVRAGRGSEKRDNIGRSDKNGEENNESD